MKRRSFLGALAAVVAAPKALMALAKEELPAWSPPLSPFHGMPGLVQDIDASSPYNVVDAQGNVLVAYDQSGNGNHGVAPNFYAVPGSRSVLFDRVLSDDESRAVHRALGF